MYTINIGLKNPVTGHNNSVDQTLAVALRYLKGINNVRVSLDGAEPTVIIEYFEPIGFIKTLSAELDQDCVAVFDHDIGQGTLIGNKADQWGDFDIQYFQLI